MNRQALEEKVGFLNRITKNPEKTFDKGKYNIGNYFLDKDIGGYALFQAISEEGAAENVFNVRTSKQELANMIDAYIKGYDEAIR